MQISDLTIKPTTEWARFKYKLNWLRNQPISAKLSKKINELLDDPNTTVSLDEYVMYLGDLPIWIKNFPYAYGRFWDIEDYYVRVFRGAGVNLPSWLTNSLTNQHQAYKKQFGKRCPNSATIWRLRQVELAARELLTSTKA